MVSEQGYHIAVVGATGAVGQKMLETLEKKNFPIKSLKLLSSSRSAGIKINFKGEEFTVEEATPASFEGVQIALFSAGGSVSKALAHEAVARGAVVVDNTSAFRMDENVPLVVPEVNEQDIANHNGIIANPNCSTIQMVAALKPIQDKFGISRVIVSTYQAVSGAGNAAAEELRQQSQAFLNGEELNPELLPVKGEKKHYPIAFNALPQIDVFQDNGYTYEEMKMINETKKIMHAPELKVAATCVRLPFFTSHAESVYVEVDGENVQVSDVQEALRHAPGVVLEDDPANQVYPTPLSASNKSDVFVGRIRRDLDNPNGFHLWVVSDNLLKGAAWNSVQIAESLVNNNWLK
ncbi:aspartate-semialdehyde dehydrogenase [Aquibacillus salsiterrae]|uniref:Aspartate-semialdehyde dehydrogenase n=1 Tax=Aquibacillus salsiterrae TaxID=2950439 RepID=A0A9X4AFT4_9BACI|nr:aspartate-semialdehyde dehydrogenase [Aquibacillus salsiterrae]MDC3416348.1 aspartate-semialdehyde dehydrogenase [Aquibacillus salsiterrae]